MEERFSSTSSQGGGFVPENQHMEETSTFDFRIVLRRCWSTFLDDLNPEKILDRFEEIGFLKPPRRIRDIREEKNTTEKNRAIINAVRKRDVGGYNIFKTILEETGHHDVIVKMKDVELELATADTERENGSDAEQKNINSEEETDFDDDTNVEDGDEFTDVETTSLGDVTSRLCNDSKNVTGNEQDTYELNKLDLQRDLIGLYKHHYSFVPFCPLIQDDRIGLNELYVDQTFHIVNNLGMPVPEKERKELNMFEDLLFEGGTPVKRVYLAAHAGMGKTTLCHKIVNDWCEAHDQNQESEEMSTDQQILKGFDFLFYIELRHTVINNVIEMIKETLLSDTKHTDTLDCILKHESEKCLIILDGLDEWIPALATPSQFSSSGFPYVPPMLNVCVLTTSRHWKLEVLQPSTTEVNRQVHLREMSTISSEQLAKTIVKFRNDRTGKEKDWRHFFGELRMNNCSHMAETPLLVTMLCCLWHDEGSIGDSLCTIYSCMVNLLFDAAECKNAKLDKMYEPVSGAGNRLPKCFESQGYCQKYFILLEKLCVLAFDALFSESKENSLVFPRKTAEIHGLGTEEIRFCCQVGILTESKVHGKALSRRTKISFVHKTFQEFLASLHVVLQDGDSLESALERIRSRCSSLEIMYEFAEVFVFLSGMRSGVATRLSKHIGELASMDKRINHYRQFTSALDDENSTQVTLIQKILIRCIRENLKNGLMDVFTLEDLELRVSDVNITNATVEEIRDLTRERYRFLDFIEEQNVKSMAIITFDDPGREVIAFLYKLTNLVKVKLYSGDFGSKEDWRVIKALLPQAGSTLKCLEIENMKILSMHEMVNLFNLCFRSLLNLKSFKLKGAFLTHWQHRYFAYFLSRNSGLIELRIGNLQCQSHDGKIVCDPCGIVLDLTNHDSLSILSVYNHSHGLDHVWAKQLYVIMLPSITATISMFSLVNAHAINISTFLSSLKRSRNLKAIRFRPFGPVSTQCSLLLLDSLKGWDNLEQCEIYKVSTENCQISLSTMKKLVMLEIGSLQMAVEDMCLMVENLPLTSHDLNVRLSNIQLNADEDPNTFMECLNAIERIKIVNWDPTSTLFIPNCWFKVIGEKGPARNVDLLNDDVGSTYICDL